MRTTTLGQLTVSAQGLGCMGMSECYGATDWAESIATIHRALDLGVTFIDTADMYGAGHNEVLVGRGDRGPPRRSAAGHEVRHRPVRRRRPPDHPRRARLREAGLRVLADQARRGPHRPVLPAPPAADGRDRGDRRRDGRTGRRGQGPPPGPVRGHRACCRRAFAVHPITAVQSEYSLWTRDVETDAMDATRELGVGFVPYSPLGRGFLTATVDLSALDGRDFRRRTRGSPARPGRRTWPSWTRSAR